MSLLTRVVGAREPGTIGCRRRESSCEVGGMLGSFACVVDRARCCGEIRAKLDPSRSFKGL